MNQRIQMIVIKFLISFLIAGGGAFLTATSQGVALGWTLGITAVVTGLVAGAQAVQNFVETPPPA